MSSTESSRIDRLDLRCQGFAKDRLVVIIEDCFAKPCRNFHRRSEDAEELLETRRTQLGLDGIRSGHARVNRTIPLGIELAHIEEVRVAKQRAAGDDDP